MIRIYNPTYGALFEFDETRPADPKRIGAWALSYASPDRGLTPEEIATLKADGKIGFYPDEFFVVGSEEWPIEKVLRHQHAVQAFKGINMEGPSFPHCDDLSNKRDRIRVDFVPGPIVDTILESSRDTAVDKVYRMVLQGVGSRFRALKAFREKALEHARNLVEAVKGVNNSMPAPQTSPRDERPRTPARERLLKFLAEAPVPLLPVDIARETGLNRHTVRRELQELLRDGLVVKQGHSYSLARTSGST